MTLVLASRSRPVGDVNGFTGPGISEVQIVILETDEGIGTLDAALWGLKAKLPGEPLWRLLGARDRFVSGYASGLDIALNDDQFPAWYRTMGERGFTSGQLKGGRDLDGDIRRLGIVADVGTVD